MQVIDTGSRISRSAQGLISSSFDLRVGRLSEMCEGYYIHMMVTLLRLSSGSAQGNSGVIIKRLRGAKPVVIKG